MAGGRPTLYTEDLGDEICAGIANALPLAKICKADNMPTERTVYRWRRKFPEFCQNYARAREDQADKLVDDILIIADACTPENCMVAKIRIDARKWTAAKFNRAFTDKVQVDQTVKINHADMDEDQLDRRIAELQLELEQSVEH